MSDSISQALPWYRQAPRVVATAASTGAAFVSVLTFLYSFGIVGKSDTRNAVGAIGVAWVGLRPAADTARSIGDTLHLAATITDKAGAAIVNARPVWTVEDPAVAVVAQDGSVIARGPGRTTVTVALGSLVARSRIVVAQQVASVVVGAEDAAGALVIGEGERRVLLARARDARGHDVAGVPASWRVADTSIARIDSAGLLVGALEGRTMVVATAAGISADAGVRVVATPSSLKVTSGEGQHAPAGAALPVHVRLEVRSRSGVAIRGVPVRFRVGDAGGAVDPATVLTDSEGRARTTWTLGSLPGRQALLAAAEGMDSVATIVAEADPRAAETRVAVLGDSLAGTAGMPLAEPVAITVTDTIGRLLRDVPVRWLAVDGSVEVLGDRTDSLGIARARWTLGPKARPQRLVVQVGAARGAVTVPPLTLTARPRPGHPARVVASRGNAQRGRAGALLAKPIVLRVEDAGGNPVPDVRVAVRPVAGAVADTVLVTDSAGVASLAWTLGGKAGPQSLRARVAGVADALVVTAVASAAAPAKAPVQQAGSPRRPVKNGRKTR